MKIPKYWASRVQVVSQADGPDLRLASWQWSDLSIEEAQQRADLRLASLALKVAAGEELNRYGYGERPLREEITQPVTSSAGSEIAVVTRNLYGALVLNTLNAMFIDIDFPEKNAGASAAGALQRMLGRQTPNVQEQYVQRIETWASRRPELGMRIYRTYGGLRCLVTNQLFDPGRPDSIEILQSLNSDPLYMRLCKAQECFRARLTPKPWRCDVDTPPSRYPWIDSGSEATYRQWQHKYEQASAQHAVCKFVKQVGPSVIHPDVAPILTLHDNVTGATRELPLA
jgi:hypothetical protein